MPRKFIKPTKILPRYSWTEENLQEAVNQIQAEEISIREAERIYGISSRTLRRRMSLGNFRRVSLGPQGIFGLENEKKLVTHIQRLSACGFVPDRKALQLLAYEFAEKLGIKHPFSQEKQMAGYDWLKSFQERNPELSFQTTKNTLLAKSETTNREVLRNFYRHLERIFILCDLLQKPANIFNMGESLIQLINQSGDNHTGRNNPLLMLPEREEYISVIACCNAEGTFLPPVVVTKGIKKESEFISGLPPGSDVYVNQTVFDTNINSDIFLLWLEEHFVPRKPAGKTVLIVNGQASYCNMEALDVAEQNDVFIFCIPNQSNHLLQPLDCFFWLFKTYFEREVHLYFNQNILRCQTSYLIGRAWEKAASIGVAISGFRATGIFPFNRRAIPDHMLTVPNSRDESDMNQLIPIITLFISSSTTSDVEINRPYSFLKVEQCLSDSNEENTSDMELTMQKNTPFPPTELLCEISSNHQIPEPFNRRRKAALFASILPPSV